jgi:hypothetical protein
MSSLIKARRTRRTPITKQSLEMEIAHLRKLDLSGLRARWRVSFGANLPLTCPGICCLQC